MSRPKAPLSVVFEKTSDDHARSLRTRTLFVGAGLAIMAVVGGVFAWPMALSTVNRSIGSSPRVDCASGTEMIFEHGIDASENTIITSVRLTGVSSSCDGAFVALALYNNSGTLVDEIVWEVSVFPGDTSATLIANGTSVSTANNSNGPVSENYPTSQTDPEGFTDNALVSSFTRAEILTLPATRAARE